VANKRYSGGSPWLSNVCFAVKTARYIHEITRSHTAFRIRVCVLTFGKLATLGTLPTTAIDIHTTAGKLADLHRRAEESLRPDGDTAERATDCALTTGPPTTPRGSRSSGNDNTHARQAASTRHFERTRNAGLIAQGESAFEPRSRRPHTSSTRLLESTIDMIIELREKLSSKGLDNGPDTITWHLKRQHRITTSSPSIIRHLRAAGLIIAAPKKRPRASYIRFAAEQPNERWQADFTHWWLASHIHAEIVCWIDDHSRYACQSPHTDASPHRARYPSAKPMGRTAFQPRSLTGSAGQLPRRMQPPPPAPPGHRLHHPPQSSLRQTQRHPQPSTNRPRRRHHIGVGRAHARTHVLMLIQDLDVRIINVATGELIRQLTVDPTRDYEPRNVPCGRPKKSP
jgi:DNA-binding transcriptional ArsR family regulator